MRRYSILGILHLLNAFLGGLIKNKIENIHKYFHKPFVFQTPFGKFLGSTVNQWTVLTPDYEPEIQKVIRKCTEKTPIEKRVLVNIGAHIGRYAIELTKNYGYTAYCFEPNPPTFKTLHINTLLSRVDDKCFLFNYALGDTNATLAFEHIAYNDGSSRILQGKEKNVNKKYITSVPVKIFDELHQDIQPSLIIMDVEGFEYQVLQGMSTSLDHYKAVDLILEIFDTNSHKQEVIDFLQGKGFHYSPIDKDNYHFWKE